MLSCFLALGLMFLHGSVAQHDKDLYSFVTLPEVRALKFEMVHIDRERQQPGYWFVAPYGQINPEAATQRYTQYQIGPYIYDNDGMLIWAGSPMYDNRNVFDFKANWNIDDHPHLSFIVQHDDHTKGSGMILNTHYEVEHEVEVLNDLDAFNMHEFNILDGGKTALACTYRTQPISLTDFGRPNEETWAMTGGFVELDVNNAHVLYEWDSRDQISVQESAVMSATDAPSDKPGTDYVHINAVDKNDAGDYIISMRFTNTLYMISGVDGHIMWRLGGEQSDFDMDFTFHKQHDVKFIESHDTHHIISLMNNGADEGKADEWVSAALFIDIDMVTMKARVIKRIERPDGGLTRLRGNVQKLPNQNTFVGWSQWGYHSEHAPNGDLLMWAKFSSERYSSYRSYKFDWIGRPNTPPDVVSSVYGITSKEILTIIHVSWNGATDIARWNFYARAFDKGENVFIGHTEKSDFETMYLANGYMDFITAEAVDSEGNVLGVSNLQRTNRPDNWQAVGFEGASPSPDDPSLLYLNGEPIEPTVDNSKTLTDSSTEPSIDSSTDASTNPSTEPLVDSSTGSSSGIVVKPHEAVYADTKEVAKSVYRAYEVLRGVEAFIVFFLVLGIIGGAVVGTRKFLRRRQVRSYKNIPSEEGGEAGEAVPVEEIPLHRNSDG
ncbi:hypothetical protein N7466_006854 [Penicillium verhagenii]|uniref:uncharacterized protein n=1 Tax=Penicillium verhagenii TaxID=1562060 RepID=UPI002544FE3C|nr:uncharacterized protein N7466_006854 [Penicillium verhagenii]KAJ5927898.1 hypothetical protein N7466_006854 [Penicillium verhagenii]